MFLLRVDVVNAVLQVIHSPKPRACCFPNPPRRTGIGVCGRADRTADFIGAAQKINLRTALAIRRLQSLVWDNTAMGGEVRDLCAKWQNTSRWSTLNSNQDRAPRVTVTALVSAFPDHVMFNIPAIANSITLQTLGFPSVVTRTLRSVGV